MPVITLLLRVLAALAGIHGTVRVAGHGAAVADVRIELDGQDRGITDSLGRYSVIGLHPGQHEFEFFSPGYEPRRVTILLADSSDLALDVELTPRPVVLPPIDVIARAPADNPAGSTTWHEAGNYRFTADWQAARPAGGVDLQQVIATLPGVATRGDYASALSIRGGRGSENLVLLDGIPLIGAIHFGGASSAINPDAISLIDVHTGVASARYDGALSGVTELQTADGAPGRLQVTGALSTTDVRSVARAPLGQAGDVLLGARSSFRNLFADRSAFGSMNGYHDFIAAGHLAVQRGSIGLVGFESGNRLSWESSPGDATLRQSGPEAAASGVPSGNDGAAWQSGAVGATWTLPLAANREWHTVGWWTGSSATISSVGANQAERVTSGLSEFGLRTELRRHDAEESWLFGGELTRPRTWYAVTTPSAALAPAAGADLRAGPLLGALYGEWDWHRSSWIDLRAGVRANSNFSSSTNLDPRFIVNLHVGPSTRVEGGFGRTHQSVQSMLNEENVTSTVIGPTLPVAATAGGPVAQADQWELSVEHQFSASLVLSVDGYRRTWSNVVTPATSGTLLLTGTPQYGNGDASGVIASIAAEGRRFSLHAAAGLATATQQAGDAGYHTGYEQPWSFSGELNYRLTSRTSFQFQWTTGAGQPRTAAAPGLGWQPYQPATGTGEIEGIAANLPGAINSLRLAGPLRFDLGIRHLWPIGAAGAGTQRRSLSTALRFENLLNRADPVGIMAGPAGSLALLRGTPRGVVFELSWIY